jgi:hypothetical protein
MLAKMGAARQEATPLGDTGALFRKLKEAPGRPAWLHLVAITRQRVNDASAFHEPG